MTRTKIEWATHTWNPVTGCTKVSEGCRHCYAERMVKRLGSRVHAREVLPNGDGTWRDGEDLPFSRVAWHHDRLDQPLHWRKPRRVFVCSMSDLFHEDVPEEFIRAVFVTMAAAKQHTFVVLTKRPRRMLNALSQWVSDGLTLREGYGVKLPNVIGMVSIEDQATADVRVPPLLQSPFAVRGVSCEPMLGPVDIATWLHPRQRPNADGYGGDHAPGWTTDTRTLDWVICGGESGPGARPCEVRWLESIVGQCKEAGVPVFVKQLGADPRWSGAASRPIEHARGKNSDPDQWPESLRVRECPA